MSNVYEITSDLFGDYAVFDSLEDFNLALRSIGAGEATERGNHIHYEGSVVGNVVDFDAAVALMDDRIRESVHDELAPCSNADFFQQYQLRHARFFREPLVVA